MHSCEEGVFSQILVITNRACDRGSPAETNQAVTLETSAQNTYSLPHTHTKTGTRTHTHTKST